MAVHTPLWCQLSSCLLTRVYVGVDSSVCHANVAVWWPCLVQVFSAVYIQYYYLVNICFISVLSKVYHSLAMLKYFVDSAKPQNIFSWKFVLYELINSIKKISCLHKAMMLYRCFRKIDTVQFHTITNEHGGFSRKKVVQTTAETPNLIDWPW